MRALRLTNSRTAATGTQPAGDGPKTRTRAGI